MGSTLIFVKSSLLSGDRLIQIKADVLDRLGFLSNEPRKHIKEQCYSRNISALPYSGFNSGLYFLDLTIVLQCLAKSSGQGIQWPLNC